MLHACHCTGAQDQAAHRSVGMHQIRHKPRSAAARAAPWWLVCGTIMASIGVPSKLLTALPYDHHCAGWRGAAYSSIMFGKHGHAILDPSTFLLAQLLAAMAAARACPDEMAKESLERNGSWGCSWWNLCLCTGCIIAAHARPLQPHQMSKGMHRSALLSTGVGQSHGSMDLCGMSQGQHPCSLCHS
jgi:hypothetical protein